MANSSASRRRRRSLHGRRSKPSRRRRNGKSRRCRRATSCTNYLREHADGLRENPFADEVKAAAKSLRQTYNIAYVQHAPLEPRTAVAEWADGKLTVWTGTQEPFRVRGELQGAFRLGDDAVRVIVPDFGSGYGGKHTGECAVEAARLAKAAGKPVMLRWTREEEFTWAYFRPAGVIEMEASLDDANRIATWRHININSGGNSIETPYNVGKKDERSRPLAAAAAPGFVPGAGVDGQLVCPRVVHGRAGGARRRRSARVSAGASGRAAAAARARSGGREVQLARARGEQAAEPRRRPGLQQGQGLVRGLLRRSGGRIRDAATFASSKCAKRSSAARCSIRTICVRRSKARS